MIGWEDTLRGSFKRQPLWLAGGEDVFVHRTAVAEGLTLSPGMAVSFVPQWDDKKNKAGIAFGPS